MLFTIVCKVGVFQSSSQNRAFHSRVIYSENYHLNERKYCPSYCSKHCVYVRIPKIYVFISMCKCRVEEESSRLTEIAGKKDY